MIKTFGGAATSSSYKMPAPNFSMWVNQHHTGELDSSRSTSLIF
jgi:hypothetical protein